MPNITITALPVATAAASTDVFPIVQIDNVTRQITNALLFTSPTITSPTLVTPALGTPASGNLSNCTGGPVFTTPNIGISTGTSLSTTGNQVISSLGKQGYTTGSGGTVTQLTSKSTGVTLNKPTGQITLNTAALAGDTTVSFVLTNSVIETNDILIMNHISGGVAGSYLLNAQAAAGSATINVRNITTGSLSDLIVIAFAVIKSVIV